MKNASNNYSDRKCTFYELLEKYGFAPIHKRNVYYLECEMFKLKRGNNPLANSENDLPNRQHRYELQNKAYFNLPKIKPLYKGLDNLSYLNPEIWELLARELKEKKILLQSKPKIKN